MMLGDMGADVIKVERPGEGDETRGWGPPFDPEGQSAYFLAVNRNKNSIAADLSNAQDRAIVLGLISGADAVLDNFLPGSLERLGLEHGLEALGRVGCDFDHFKHGVNHARTRVRATPLERAPTRRYCLRRRPLLTTLSHLRSAASVA